MKATFLTSVFAVLVATANLNAKDVKVYSNVSSNESGVNKEYVALDEETSKPLSKGTYNYSVDGKIQDKTVSKWQDDKGWVNAGKHEYQYGKSGKISSITYTKWDDKTGRWSSTSSLIINVYNDNDEFLSVKQIQIDNTTDDHGFISQK
jgi:hypothetical protein